MKITASAKSPFGEVIEVTVTLPDRFSAEVVKPLEILVKTFCEVLEHNLRSTPDISLAVDIIIEKMREAASIIAVYGKLIFHGEITREEFAKYRRLQRLITSTGVE